MQIHSEWLQGLQSLRNEFCEDSKSKVQVLIIQYFDSKTSKWKNGKNNFNYVYIIDTRRQYWYWKEVQDMTTLYIELGLSTCIVYREDLLVSFLNWEQACHPNDGWIGKAGKTLENWCGHIIFPIVHRQFNFLKDVKRYLKW